MHRRELKERLLDALERGDGAEMSTLLGGNPPHRSLAALFAALCHSSPKVRGNAVCGFALLVPAMAARDAETARIVMRRLLWSLNEESGGIGWGAAEAMAAILGVSPLLRREYLQLLCSYVRQDGPELFQEGNFLELPMLQRGLLAGIGDLCRDHREEMLAQDISAELLNYLFSADQQVVGLAARCLGFLGESAARESLIGLLDHPGRVDLFADGRPCMTTVGELASAALAGIAGEESSADPSREASKK